MLLGKRVKEVGKSKGRAVMARIRVQRSRSHLARKRADFQLVFGHEIVCVIFEGWEANERAVYVCTDRRTDAMARDRLGQGVRLRKKNANSYREGDSGKPLEQGASLAKAVDLLVLWQSVGRKASH
jgi:hypothetical protein